MAGEFTLKIAGHVAEYAPQGRAEFVLAADGRPLRDVLRELGLRKELIRVLIVDGKRVSADHVPSDGEVVTLVAPASGG